MGAEVTTPLPQYQCHKVVGALKIKSVQWLVGGGVLQVTPEDEGFAPFKVDKDWVRRWSGHDLPGGYYVVYADSYKSFSPAKVFEEGYTRISQQQEHPQRKPRIVRQNPVRSQSIPSRL